jgi:hypothetical protein
VGYLILSLVVALVPLLRGRQLQRQALPIDEGKDFLKLGSATQWHRERAASLRGPIGEFVRAVNSETSQFARIDLMCERLADVDSQTRQIAEQYTMLVRTVLALGGLFSVVVVGGAVRARAAWQVAWGLLPFIFAAFSAFWCHWMGRMVSCRVAERRRNWDALSRLLVGPHMSGSHVEGEAHSPGG